MGLQVGGGVSTQVGVTFCRFFTQ